MAEEQENTVQYEVLPQNDLSGDQEHENELSASYQPVPPSSPYPEESIPLQMDQQLAQSQEDQHVQHDTQDQQNTDHQQKNSEDSPEDLSHTFSLTVPQGEEYLEALPEESEAEAEAEEEESLPFPLPQYVQPQMPTDLRICDKYFVKPGQYSVTDSGTLVPGTGLPPPNIPLPEALKDDILIPLLGLIVGNKDSQFSFFKGLVDHCSIDTLEKDEDEISEEELIFESFDSEYLKRNLGIPLTLALAEIVAKKPTDPIHYLGHWLFKWHYNQEDRQNEYDKINEIIHERERIAAAQEERKRLEAEKITHVLIEELLTNMPEPQDLFDGREEARDEEYGEISEEIAGVAMSDIDPHNTEQYGEQN